MDVMFKNQQSAVDKAFRVHIKVGAVTRLWHLIYSLSCSPLILKEDLSVMIPQLCSLIACIELKKKKKNQSEPGRESRNRIHGPHQETPTSS